MIITTYVTSIIVLALWIAGHGNVPIMIFSAIFGSTSGTFVSMIPAIVAQVTKDVRNIGTRNGSNFFIIRIAALSGNPIAGALVAHDGGGFLYL
ncbi:Major facilitator superfamily domain general substrate transporter [Penicillium sp. CMV-2018d]|nr:Major facilitator superfamily domain general substrate transporter [Penicillium sp. CMV-2018d]